MTERHCVRGMRRGRVVPCCCVHRAAPAIAAGCAFEPQGEGRVAAVIDARTFRLDDGREIRLAGIEPATPDKAKAAAALSAIVWGAT